MNAIHARRRVQQSVGHPLWLKHLTKERKSMDVTKVRLCVYGQNNSRLGTMDSEGVIRSDRAVIFRVRDCAVYSMHEGYLGKLVDGVCRTSRGELLFILRDS
ncbi:hypothetical protein ALO83_102689 [Pseudomonas cannabina pv. alisalensis]|uniref:Uncharacterized protein n=1 Tax=Pseudomonas cannabina TaxID=86840 RepID=A0A3M3RHI9_PSECA|nr:hypothetical protein ALO83_102689 [Pseudomonas cannabina pv. alisalensis]RMN78301.1 hypothetical protein ALQ52_103242 [Pseudomonas cannabina pv. alisalensis]RMN84298.1 hypothetical protein ALQ53_102571 [Pseudomonas cannabina]RMN95882.1 hypothetical protein ALQ51_101509 [Pseudomonas cannabina]